MDLENRSAIQPPAELRFARELAALSAHDTDPRPVNWKLSPRAVRQFILGSEESPVTHDWQGKKAKTAITRKYYGYHEYALREHPGF